MVLPLVINYYSSWPSPHHPCLCNGDDTVKQLNSVALLPVHADQNTNDYVCLAIIPVHADQNTNDYVCLAIVPSDAPMVDPFLSVKARFLCCISCCAKTHTQEFVGLLLRGMPTKQTRSNRKPSDLREPHFQAIACVHFEKVH